MKKLLNTLFITTENAYATLDGENVVVKQDSITLGRFPLHILDAIFIFSYLGASPMLMGKCVQDGINLCFCRPTGQKRLNKIAKICLNYGQRVQNSAFECNVDAGQFVKLKNELRKIVDTNSDSLRFYNLGTNYKSKIEHWGAKAGYDSEGLLEV